MPETDRLSQCLDWIELEFVEREATPPALMELGIQLHLAGLSLSKTISILENHGIERCRSTVHNWVQKADVEPAAGRAPDQVAIDETVIEIDGERHWLFAAIDPSSNRFLHVRLFTTRTIVLTEHFVSQLREKHTVDDATFLVDGAPWLQTALHRIGLEFRHETNGDRNSVERVFKEVKRRTNQFANHFRHASVESAENWLQAFATAWNQLI